MKNNLPPSPDSKSGPPALKTLLKERNILSVLLTFNHHLGDIFRLPMPGLTLYVLAGPEAARFLMASHRASLLWRMENDPVAKLLRQGVLMQDGDSHDDIRRRMMPPLQRKSLDDYVPQMLHFTDAVSSTWQDDQVYNMHLEMRKLALLILTSTLFDVDCTNELSWLVPAVKKALKYVSPGLWLVWRGVPRPGYQEHLERIDQFLYRIIAERRANPSSSQDLLTILVNDPEMDDDLIRDQLLTMLIAGHDTSTSLLSWVLYFLSEHPHILKKTQEEIDAVLGVQNPDAENVKGLVYLDQVIKETLRFYPPIHAGNRVNTEDLEFQGYTIPKGSRMLFSIYLTHHNPEHWKNPEIFDPDRFAPEEPTPPPYTYIPFGGGPRNCIGAAFAQVEARIILARLLQAFDFRSTGKHVMVQMGASLDPHPGVFLKVNKRKQITVAESQHSELIGV
jgi:cytochrome P450